MTEMVLYPIIVGVTGHRDIASAAVSEVRRAVRAVLAGLREEFNDTLHVMSALAEGADQLVAAEADLLGIKLIVVVPMELDVYPARLNDPEKFDTLWDAAALRFVLPPADQRYTDGPGQMIDKERQYEQLGALLARRSHILLALWDGTDKEAEAESQTWRGGTSDVIRMRQKGDYDVHGFRFSPMFSGAASRLDLIPGGPILQVVTPRIGNRVDNHIAMPGENQAGTCYLLPITDGQERTVKVRVNNPIGVFTMLCCRERNDFTQIAELNNRISDFDRVDRKIFDQHVCFLKVKGLPDPGTSIPDPGGDRARQLSLLRATQAGADAAAQYFQRRLLGQFVPAPSIPMMLSSAWKFTRSYRRLPRLGAVFLFTSMVPIGVLSFEIYSHFGVHWAILIYAMVLSFPAAYYFVRVEHDRWQDHFQDYRALAEAMRVQLYWALSATSIAVSDNYLRKQRGEIGWIQFALRGPSLWAAALAISLPEPARDYVVKGWIDNQKEFFLGTSERMGRVRLNHKAAERGKLWRFMLLFAGWVLSIVMAGREISHGIFCARGCSDDHVAASHDMLQNGLLAGTAVTLAMAVFFAVSGNLRAYEAHARSYSLMGRIFSRAQTSVTPAMSDSEFQDLVRELGREALSENAEWVADHRNRQIEPP